LKKLGSHKIPHSVVLAKLAVSSKKEENKGGRIYFKSRARLFEELLLTTTDGKSIEIKWVKVNKYFHYYANKSYK
jgi:hypothetical protein